MPSKMAQGQGSSTEFKERGLSAAFYVNLKIFKNRFDKFTYFHFDLNAGSGFNELGNCEGSPLAFLRAAGSAGISKMHAAFVEIDKGATQELMKSIETAPMAHSCFVHHGDNFEFIRLIPQIIRHYGENPLYAIGTVLSDPNGSRVPLNDMAWLSQRCPKLDFVINWNSTQFKRDRNNPGLPDMHDRPDLFTAIKMLNKKHWLIRSPITSYQFTLLIGRNVKVGDHKLLGFYHLESEKGRAIFNKCNLTKQERRGGDSTGQIPLFA